MPSFHALNQGWIERLIWINHVLPQNIHIVSSIIAFPSVAPDPATADYSPRYSSLPQHQESISSPDFLV